MQKEIKGKLIDDSGRCEHWHSPLDIIAIKFYCCGDYYSCYQCHEAEANHYIKSWPNEMWDQKAVMCGNCAKEMSITDYMNSRNACPNCQSDFNPNCSYHWGKYFDLC